MQIRAKFVVSTVTKQVGQEQVTLCAVTSGSEENKSFAKYTPSGVLNLTIDNPATVGFFEPGREYYLDITVAQ